MPLGRSCIFTRVLPIRILLDTDREDPAQVQLLYLQPTYLSQENEALHLCLHTFQRLSAEKSLHPVIYDVMLSWFYFRISLELEPTFPWCNSYIKL